MTTYKTQEIYPGTPMELPLVEMIDEAIKTGMRTDNAVMKNTYRRVKTIYTEELKNGKEAGNATMKTAIEKAAKDFQKSIAEYTKAGRNDLVAEEKAAMILLEPFLPKKMSTDEIKKEVERLMIDNNITEKREMGKIMGMLSKNKAIDMAVAKDIVLKAFQ